MHICIYLYTCILYVCKSTHRHAHMRVYTQGASSNVSSQFLKSLSLSTPFFHRRLVLTPPTPSLRKWVAVVLMHSIMSFEVSGFAFAFVSISCLLCFWFLIKVSYFAWCFVCVCVLYECMYLYMYVCIFMHVCIYIYICYSYVIMCAYACMHIYIYIYTYVYYVYT
jgi:hypothetical protein